MSRVLVDPDFLIFIRGLADAKYRGLAEVWRRKVVSNPDMWDAAIERRLDQARTTLAGVTYRVFPASRDLPPTLRNALRRLGVDVRW
ncbi:MAG TPA: hypothetical protein VEA38_01650 [Terriglobales bacterium]|nr:hypothetical protein [Terriglobales bacterium]